MRTIAAITVTTTPALGAALSTTNFLYSENYPNRCVAQRMQLAHHADGRADFRSADTTLTGPAPRIRPGDHLTVDGAVFEVWVPEGMGAMFPYLRRIDA